MTMITCTIFTTASNKSTLTGSEFDRISNHLCRIRTPDHELNWVMKLHKAYLNMALTKQGLYG